VTSLGEDGSHEAPHVVHQPPRPPRATERLVSLNGELVAESRALISHRDRGFRWGDSAFDTMRTFHHHLFLLDEHLDRLERSLRYIGIDSHLSRSELAARTTNLVRENARLLSPEDDYWVTIRVSAGVDPPTRGPSVPGPPAVVIHCDPLPFFSFKHLYNEGVVLITPSIRRTPPECLDPRAKLGNYLNHKLANLEAHGVSEAARPLLLDIEGNIAESSGANFFIVRNGEILTPPQEHVLPGISRKVTIDLARNLGIPVTEQRLTLFDAYTADEAFLTATSFCLIPVARVNRWAPRTVAGPIVARLTRQWSDLVGLDIVAQAQLDHVTPVSS
jgi:branched-chain amino acid aminotransferase